VKLGASWGMPDTLVPRTVRIDPKSRTFANRLVGGLLVSAPNHVFTLPCKV
jgi:hypothetical protein